MSKPEITFDKGRHSYTVNGQKVPSVTTVLGMLDKPGVAYWTARVTAEGAWKLARRRGYMLPEEPEEFVRDLKRFGYDSRSQMDKAAARGTAVHEVLEGWIKEERIPVATEHPKHVAGYVRGLAKFLIERRPVFYESEVLVGSATHGYAGTRDTVCVLAGAEGRELLDLKTSKRIYPEYFLQVEAYELAGIECEEEPTDRRGVVRVTPTGEYEVRYSCALPKEWLAILAAYKARAALTERARKEERKR